MLRTLAHRICAAFNLILISICPSEEHPLHQWHRGESRGAYNFRIRIHRNPSEHTETFFGCNFFNISVRTVWVFWINECNARRIVARFRQLHTRYAAKELVWDLKQNSSTVAGLRFSTYRTTMIKVTQSLQALLNNLMRCLTTHLSNEGKTAGIALKGRIIKTLLSGVVMHVNSLSSNQHSGRHWFKRGTSVIPTQFRHHAQSHCLSCCWFARVTQRSNLCRHGGQDPILQSRHRP